MVQKRVLSGLRALIVDDNEFFADVISQVLALEKIRSRIATNKNEALEHLRQTQFDVVICDYNLPDVVGSSLILEIRRVTSAPVICVSGSEPIELESLFASNHLSGFLNKPFTRDSILEKLDTVIFGHVDR